MIIPLPPYPAALLRVANQRTVVIADLHVGWEMALSNEGIHVPSQTSKLLKKLLDVLFTYSPQRLLILGDVKHTVASAEKAEWRDVPDFFTEVRKHVREIIVLRGNHDGNLDPLLPENVQTFPGTGLALNDVGFFHGHQWPSPTLLRCKTLMMGHVHPVVAFRDPAGFRVTRQVWIKATCDTAELTKVLLQKHGDKIQNDPETAFRRYYRTKPRSSQLFIMPSFNDFLGGRPLNERRLFRKTDGEMVTGPVLRTAAVNMKDAEAYLLDGTFLGTLEQLRSLS